MSLLTIKILIAKAINLVHAIGPKINVRMAQMVEEGVTTRIFDPQAAVLDDSLAPPASRHCSHLVPQDVVYTRSCRKLHLQCRPHQ